MKPPHVRPNHPAGLRRSREPDWYDEIKAKLKKHLGWLKTKYRIKTHTVEEMLSDVVSSMVQIEKKGRTIEFPLTYSKTVARNLVVNLQKKEYEQREKELLIQKELHEELRSGSVSRDEKLMENSELCCQLLGAFEKVNEHSHNLIIMRDIQDLEFKEIALFLYGSDDKKACDATRQRHHRARRDFISFARNYLGLDP